MPNAIVPDAIEDGTLSRPLLGLLVLLAALPSALRSASSRPHSSTPAAAAATAALPSSSPLLAAAGIERMLLEAAGVASLVPPELLAYICTPEVGRAASAAGHTSPLLLLLAGVAGLSAA